MRTAMAAAAMAAACILTGCSNVNLYSRSVVSQYRQAAETSGRIENRPTTGGRQEVAAGKALVPPPLQEAAEAGGRDDRAEAR